MSTAAPTPLPTPLPVPVPPVDATATSPRVPNPLDAHSVRTVGGTLRQGRMTAMELRHACGLPRRTVYRALAILREQGLVQQRRSLRDSRQSYFWLVAAASPPATNLQMEGQLEGPLQGIAAEASADEPATSVL